MRAYKITAILFLVKDDFETWRTPGTSKVLDERRQWKTTEGNAADYTVLMDQCYDVCLTFRHPFYKH
jgi:hypothetical protein